MIASNGHSYSVFIEFWSSADHTKPLITPSNS